MSEPPNAAEVPSVVKVKTEVSLKKRFPESSVPKNEVPNMYPDLKKINAAVVAPQKGIPLQSISNPTLKSALASLKATPPSALAPQKWIAPRSNPNFKSPPKGIPNLKKGQVVTPQKGNPKPVQTPMQRRKIKSSAVVKTEVTEESPSSSAVIKTEVPEDTAVFKVPELPALREWKPNQIREWMCALDTSLPMKVKEVDIQIPITNEAILRQWAAMWVAFTRAPLDDPHFPLSMKKPVDYGLIPLPMSETPTKDKDLFMGNLFMEQYKWLTLLEARYRPPYMRWLGAGVTATMDIPSGSYLCSYRGFHSSDEEEVERYSSRFKRGSRPKNIVIMKDREEVIDGSMIGWLLEARIESLRMFIPGPIVRHSSVHPNCKAKLWKHKFGCDLVLKATRNIAEGEELLWDHGSDASDKTCICAKCNGLCSCDECGGHHLHGPYMGNLNSQYKVDPLLSMVTFDDGKMAAVMLNCIDMIRNVISNNLPHVSTDGQSELFEKMLTLLDTRVEDSKIEKVARKIQRKGYSFSAGQIMEMLQMQARYASVSISQMKRFGRLLKFTHSYNYIIKEEENNDIVIATAHGVTTNATQEFAPTHYWWCSSQDLPKGYFTIAPVGDYRQRQRMLCMPFASQISEAVRRMNQHLMHRTVKLMSVSV